jgi:hypothetical protein
MTDEQVWALLDLTPRPRQACAEGRDWLLELEWREGEDAYETIRLLNQVGIVRAVERHYDGGWKQFLNDGALL